MSISKLHREPLSVRSNSTTENVLKMDPADQGYDEKRFLNAVDAIFLCPICMNVLKDPVQCRENEHHYCTPCITRHLEQNSQTCPYCMEALTVETLKKPSRIVINYLSPLKINCDYASRGCRAVVELGVLKTHEKDCTFSPIACSISGCSMIVNRRDKEHHETQVCEYRMVKCDDCGEVQQRKYKAHGCVLRKEMDEIKINLVEMRNMIAEIKEEVKKMTKQAFFGLPRGDFIVAGGAKANYSFTDVGVNSAEMFSWTTRAWVPLPPMKQGRFMASSFVYENQVMVSGGVGDVDEVPLDSMERMKVNEEPKQWLDCPTKLPFLCFGHASVIYQNRLIITGGGDDEGEVRDGIYEVLLKPPYTSKLLCSMPQPRWGHGAVLWNDKILIVGGRTAIESSKESTESILLYDVKENKCKEMVPLPYAMSSMATVCYEDNLVIMGGIDKNENVLNKVIMYNINTGEYKMLPNMNVEREGCMAIITGNVIVVMGGGNELEGFLNSAECFNFDHYVWEGMPPMNECRAGATATVITTV